MKEILYTTKRAMTIIMVLFYILSLISCFRSESPDKNSNDKKKQESAVTPENDNIVLHVVLFDISRSLGQVAFNSALEKLTRYVCQFDQTKTNNIIIFTVHRNTARQNSSVFRKSIAPNSYSRNRAKSLEYLKNREVDAKSAIDSIKAVRQKIDIHSNILNESCFIDALQSAKNVFLNEDYAQSMKCLVLIGDMIEDCSRIQIDLDRDSADLLYPKGNLDNILQEDTFLQSVQIKIFVPKRPIDNPLPAWYTDPLLRKFWEYVLTSQGANSAQVEWIL